jgi:hypothetical protein
MVRSLSRSRGFVIRVFREGGLATKIAEFLVEVAVLVMVFPILDTVIEKDLSKVTLQLVFWSIVISVGCLFVAGIISMIGGSRR